MDGYLHKELLILIQMHFNRLHSYFVSTMPRPYDRQLISDTFVIDDAFMDRTLTFQNGDRLMASFKATNTQNVPVFFHAINNEGYIVDKK